MKTTLLGAVAIAALLAHAGATSAQVNVGEPEVRKPGVEQSGRSPERQQERAQERQERAKERAQDAQERVQERAQERARNGEERVQERERAADPQRNRATRTQREAQDSPPATAPTPPARGAATQANGREESPTAQEKTATEQQKTTEQQKAAEQEKVSGEREKASTAQEKPAEPGASPSAAETQPPATPPAQRSTQGPAPSPTEPANPAATDTGSGTGSAVNSFDQQQPGSGTTAQPGTAQPGTAQPGTTTVAPQQEQRILDTVQQRIERREVQPVTNLGVTANVGATLPARVELNPLPRDIVSIRPAYRDYRYVVSQEEVIIVDPRSRRVVEVIDRRGGGRTGAVDERRFFEVIDRRSDQRRWRGADVVIDVGVVLPASAPFYDVPVEIVERNPRWRGYQYVVVEDEVAIVEPRTRRVVQVIERNAAQGGGSARPAGRVEVTGSLGNLGEGDRRAINAILLRQVKPGTLAGMRDLRGSTLPEELELQPLPREVIQRSESLRAYRYVLIGDDALIVDPRNRRVIDVIR